MAKLTLKDKFVSGIRWQLVGQAATQSLYLISTIVLARLLGPSDFSIAAIALSIVAFFQICFGLGFARAILPKQTEDEKHFHTLFTFYLCVAVLSVCLIYPGAVLAARYYDNAALALILKILCIQAFFTIFSSLPRIIMEKRFQYKEINYISFWTFFLNVLIAIGMAITGWGYWALIIPGVVTAILEAIIYFICSHYVPKIDFNWGVFRKYLWFGIYTTGTDVLNTVVNRADYLILGRVWSPVQLGTYFFAYEKANRPFKLILGRLFGLLLPTLSALKDDKERFQRVYLKFVEVSMMLVISLGVLFIFSADKFFPLIFGPQWNSAILLFQLFIVRHILNTFGHGVPVGLMVIDKTRYIFQNAFNRFIILVPTFFILQYLKAEPLTVAVWVLILDTLIYSYFFIISLRLIKIPLLIVFSQGKKVVMVGTLMMILMLGFRWIPGFDGWNLWAQFIVPTLLAASLNVCLMKRDYVDLYQNYFKKKKA